MAFERQLLCDGCSKVLRGSVNGKKIGRDHYQIDGKVLLQIFDPRTLWNEWIYLTKEPSEMLSFCLIQGFPCQQSYFDKKRGAYQFHKQQRLREEAAKENIDRLERG